MLEDLKKMKTLELKKLIAKYNKSSNLIRGYSKMKKQELIDTMMKDKHKDFFIKILTIKRMHARDEAEAKAKAEAEAKATTKATTKRKTNKTKK